MPRLWPICQLLMFACLSTASAQSDIFERAATQTDDARIKRLSEKPYRTIECVYDGTTKEIAVEVEGLYTSNQYLIEIRLTNRSMANYTFDSLISSCGCIAGLPRDAKFANGETLPIRFDFTVSRKGGNFAKLITLTDKKREESIKLILNGKATPLANLKSERFALKDLPRQSVSAVVEFVDVARPILDYEFTIVGETTENLTVETISKRSAKISFVVLQDAHQVESTNAFLVIKSDGKVFTELEMRFARPFIATARPSVINLSKSGDKYNGRVLIQIEGMTERFCQDTSRIKGIARVGDISKYEFDIDCSFRFVQEGLAVANLSTTDKRLTNGEEEVELGAMFKTEFASLEVPMTRID